MLSEPSLFAGPFSIRALFAARSLEVCGARLTDGGSAGFQGRGLGGLP
jgi:hypothetical protein